MSPGGWCRLLLYFAAQSAMRSRAWSDVGASPDEFQRGHRRSWGTAQRNQGGGAKGPGGHSRSRAPWSPL